jgi:putative hydrolase of the HAD superfamily
MIEAVLFDLDDTLYPEREFVMGGFRAVARQIAQAASLRSEDVLEAMLITYETCGRQAVLPAAMSKFLNSSFQIADLVEVYRNHTPLLSMPRGYGRLLRELRLQYKLGIITDGIPAIQRRKIKALGLEDTVDNIICTWDHGSEKEKPDPLGFSLMLQQLCLEPAQAIYVGDNPGKDCIGAHRARMKFVLVRTPGRNGNGTSHETGRAEFVIESLHQLPQTLQTAEQNACD